MRSLCCETERHCGGVGSPPSSGGAHAIARREPQRGGRVCGCKSVVGEALEGGVAERRRRRPGRQDSSRSQAAIDDCSETGPRTHSPTRPARGGLFHGPLDLLSGRRIDSSNIRREVSSRSRLADSAGPGLVLPEARTASPRAGRRGDRSLANAGVAADKKRACGEKLASSSRTKAASCSSRCGAAPGLPAAERLSCARGTVAIASRRSAPLRSLRRGAACRSTSAGSQATSRPRTWSRSSGSCIVISGPPSRWSGTAADRIAKRRGSCWPADRAGCGSSGCRPTLRNSTRPSRSGTTPRASIWPTTRPTILRSSPPTSGHRSPDNDKASRCCLPTSNMLN